MRNNVLPRGRSTKISKTKTDQRVSPSSAPLERNGHLILGCGSLHDTSCGNRLITAGPGWSHDSSCPLQLDSAQITEHIGRAAGTQHKRIQWNPGLGDAVKLFNCSSTR